MLAALPCCKRGIWPYVNLPNCTALNVAVSGVPDSHATHVYMLRPDASYSKFATFKAIQTTKPYSVTHSTALWLSRATGL